MAEDQRTHLKRALTRLFHPCFDGALKDPDLRSDLAQICVAGHHRLIPEAEITTFTDFRAAYAPTQEQLSDVFVPVTGDATAGTFSAIDRFGLFDQSNAAIITSHLPRIRVCVGPRLPRLLFDDGSMTESFDERFRTVFFETLTAGDDVDPDHAHTRVIELLREVNRCIETHIARGDSPFPDGFTTQMRAFFVDVCNLIGLTCSELPQSEVIGYIRRNPEVNRNNHPFFVGRARPDEAGDGSQFLSGFNFEASDPPIPALGTITLNDASELVRELDNCRQRYPETPGYQTLFDTLRHHFFQPQALLARPDLAQLIDALPERDGLIPALARDTGAHIIGERDSAIDLKDPVLQDASLMIHLHPRIDASRSVGQITESRRVGLWHVDRGLVLAPDADVCAMDAFPERLSSALRWYEAQHADAQDDSKTLLDRHPHTGRFFERVIWAMSDLSSCFSQPLPSHEPSFLEAAQLMLTELGKSPSFDYAMERAVTDLLQASIADANLIAPDADGQTCVSVAFLGSADNPEEPNAENTWGDASNPQCLWRLPGLTGVPDRSALPAKPRVTSFSRLDPIWVEARKLIDAVAPNDQLHRLHQALRRGFDELGPCLNLSDLKAFMAIVVFELEDFELSNSGPGDGLSPTDLDRFLRQLDGSFFPEGKLQVWTRFDSPDHVAQKSRAFNVLKIYDLNLGPGQWKGILRRGVASMDESVDVWKPAVLVQNDGPIDPNVLFLDALRPLLDRHKLMTTHQQALLDGLDTDSSWQEDEARQVIGNALLAVLFWSALAEVSSDYQTQRILQAIRNRSIPFYVALIFLTKLDELKKASDEHTSRSINVAGQTYRVEILRQAEFDGGERLTLNFGFPQGDQTGSGGGFMKTYHFRGGQLRALEQAMATYLQDATEDGG